MKKHIITILPIALVMLVMSSCQPNPPKADGQNSSTEQKDTIASQSIKPAESGYATSYPSWPTTGK
jgi:hypothetical protein